ncbi:MAG: SPFH domain-containing protein [Lachnospiraceae bacterium]|nr:SPFH domain-containing protein [Lachnospiraceae bacterium]
MGLIKAASGATHGTLADQWKEYFYCESLNADILAAKGERRTSRRSGNKKGDDNIITDGSHIVVADGQCMMIVEDGKVLEVCAEPGAYTYDMKTSPSVFADSLIEGLGNIAIEVWNRFQFGGGTGKDQRIYYFNTKEIPGNKYGTPNPVPFRVVDLNIGLDIDISIRCNGEYSYRIVNPILFYTNVCGNIQNVYTRNQIDSMLKAELLTALQPAFARISDMGIRYSSLPGHTMEIADALNDILTKKWTQLRGLQIYSFGINSVSASKEDEQMIKDLQKSAVMRDPTMAAATLAGAQADAMRSAAKNSSGAMTGFMGYGMAGQAGGMNPQDLYEMGRHQTASQSRQSDFKAEKPTTGWICSCGAENKGKFCSECGTPKPADEWVCSCGTVNKGKFCSECGKQKQV